MGGLQKEGGDSFHLNTEVKPVESPGFIFLPTVLLWLYVARKSGGDPLVCFWLFYDENDDQTFSGASLGSAATRVNYQSSALEFNIDLVKA